MGAVEVQPPPPTPDFDGDGVAHLEDVDALVAEIAAQTHDLAFDLNGDELVDRQDLSKWLDDAPEFNGLAVTRYLIGDANLDTFVDLSDFNQWNNNKFTVAAAWSKGDFNASGVIDASDFNLWNANKFTQSPLPSGCGLSGRGVAERGSNIGQPIGEAHAGEHESVTGEALGIEGRWDAHIEARPDVPATTLVDRVFEISAGNDGQREIEETPSAGDLLRAAVWGTSSK